MADEMIRVAQFWNESALGFDAIYSGRKSAAAKFLDAVFRRDIYQRQEWTLERCGDVRGVTICDVGCGSGRYVKELALRGAAQVTGVDVAPEMLRLARQAVSAAGVAHNCDFVQADVLDWNPGAVYDQTIAIGFWDYIAEPLDRLRVIRSLTRQRFLSAWPRYWTWRMPIRKARLFIQGCPVYFYRRPQVEALLHEAGFTVERVDVVGKLFCVESQPA